MTPNFNLPFVSYNGAGQIPSGFHRVLDTVGDGSGVQNAIDNYSGGAQDFFWQIVGGLLGPTTFYPTYISVWIDAIDTTFTGTTYADTGAALTNGIEILTEINSVETLLDDTAPIKNNAQLISYFNVPNFLSYDPIDPAQSAIFLQRNITSGIRLNSVTDDKIIVRLNDDFTGISNSQFFSVGGYLV